MPTQIYDVPQLLDEELVTLKEAAKLFPVPISPSTIERFLRKGSNGKVLESIKIAGRRMTSKEAIGRFILGGLHLPQETSRPSKKRVGMSDVQLEAARIKFKLPKPGEGGKRFEELTR